MATHRPAESAIQLLHFQSPLGWLVLQASQASIHALDFLAQAPTSIQPAQTPLLQVASQALSTYFANPDHARPAPNPFPALPLVPLPGTAFQQAVWAYLSDIPLGETRSYGEVARALSSSPRAVGQACRRNPLPILIPCHRVVARTGLGGYSGATEGPEMQRKVWLLDHEKTSI
ncbi:methylated-DNA--[protein]-cysteine S-methyltransferase [Thermithiobacillus plumbiphilus]|uniref:Methylated-DNA--[protein]-cysteine S-methyltransferase n=1 Tax=Thermithiobacillus plumbiphilus TaxID=1729899 RepID=A0ABU9D6A1_9PROT